MTDRVPGAPGQYKMVVTPEQFAKMQAGESAVITITRDDHPITNGTPYSKKNVLPDELANVICPDILDPTPADALRNLIPRKEAMEKLAPSGFGLGVDGVPVPENDLNSAVKNGWYSITTGCRNSPVSYGICLVLARENQNITQIVKSADDNSGSILIRHKQSNIWESEWSWLNPPMKLGVEYKTTEKWQGNPVYTKMVYFGAVPKNSASKVAHGISGSFRVLRCFGSTDIGDNIPFTLKGESYNLSAGPGNIWIETINRTYAGALNATVQLWYAKF